MMPHHMIEARPISYDEFLCNDNIIRTNMVLPEEDETLVCEYCGKETVATQNMDHYWLCLSEVKGGEESLEVYLCSQECLKAYVNEPTVFLLARTAQDSKKTEWQIEELLIRSNLLDKVNRHKRAQETQHSFYGVMPKMMLQNPLQNPKVLQYHQFP